MKLVKQLRLFRNVYLLIVAYVKLKNENVCIDWENEFWTIRHLSRTLYTTCWTMFANGLWGYFVGVTCYGTPSKLTRSIRVVWNTERRCGMWNRCYQYDVTRVVLSVRLVLNSFPGSTNSTCDEFQPNISRVSPADKHCYRDLRS